MNCIQGTMDKNVLYRFFEGVSTPEQERLIAEWIDHDPTSERIFNAERKIYNTLMMMDRKDLPAVGKPKTRRIPRWTRELMRTAAILALTVGIGYRFYADLERRMDVAQTSIYVPVGQQLDITLSDGSKVTVNGSSTITYPAIFSGNQRRVQLSGEAYFAVNHDSKHPFVVETSKYDVEVLGTEFNVEAYENSGKFITSLVHGKVKVTNNDDPEESVVLMPNQKVQLAAGKLVVETIPEYENFQWRDGLIAFKQATFVEMMELFEKYYGVHVLYNAARLPKTTFSGKIRISEGVDHALWALQQSAPFRYEKNADSMIITIK